MNFENMSMQEIDEEIETYKDRIETLSEYISEIDDTRIIPVLNSQLQGYKSTLRSLYNEVNSRSSISKPSKEIGEIYFESSNNSLFKSSDLITRSFGTSTIKISEKDDLFELIIEHQTQTDLFTCNLTYPIIMKRSPWQFEGRLVLQSVEKNPEFYGVGIVFANGAVSEIVFDVPEKYEHVCYYK